MRSIFVQGMWCGRMSHTERQRPSRLGGSCLFILVCAILASAMYPLPEVQAENLKRPVRIGVLTESWGPTPGIIGLRDGLEALGYRENHDYFLGVRFTQGNLAELPAAARELVQHGVDLKQLQKSLRRKTISVTRVR